MTTDERPAARKPRADAERNRHRLLMAAKESFAANGTGASLEDIARAAGVGIGTLYRHFPTRDALIEEVYRQSVDELGKAAERLSRSRPPIEALREWMLLFVDYLATKKIMAEALGTLAGGPADLYAASGVTLQSSMALLTGRAVASGDIALEVEPLDLLRAVGGVAYASPGTDWQAAARRMVDIIVAGMKRG